MSQIVVNHLTRMHGQHICVAGIDPDTHQHVRPVRGHLGRDLLSDSGGPVDIGAIVELGDVQPRPNPPHAEDCLFEPAAAQRRGRLDPHDYLSLIEAVSFDSLEEAFGNELQRVTTKKFATEEGCGERSLACLRPPSSVSVSYSDDKLELNFSIDGVAAAATVTDLRYFEEDGRTTRRESVRELSRRLRRGTPAWLMFGFARALEGSRVEGSWHWLQLNGICLEDDPLWPSAHPERLRAR